jgi:hypothetical protein
MNRMKFLLAIVAIVWPVPFALLHAQEPPLPTKTETPTPSPAGVRPQLNIPEIPMSVEPPTLVPNSSSPIPRRPALPTLAKTAPALSELDAAFRTSPLAKAAEVERLHLEWRQLQNRTAYDPEVVAAREAATRTKTDVEKRTRLRAYYNIYYAHMRALASSPEIIIYLDGQKAAALNSLAQPRVRPMPTPRASPAH